ncbi:CHAT domain-containing protein [Pyxidicoccus xibeiensis]|uniref:CHAT domain-containing protein n=1 Tax=Pyxidicoccus xibeiensis TaxID=2906759 RepID=UPI0020A79ABC|nr:CHAT domain-containing protein [Pyxidicoccus xibeiensis]MCP3137620.1 CHAT domain-containing protein [Pyxidicoccus xibeiensis]
MLAQQAGGPHGVTLGSLKQAVDAEPAPALDGALLEEIHAHLDEADTLPRLLLCMQCLRWLSGTPSMIVEVYRFTRSAIEAIHALGRQELLPFRLSLIDGLLVLDLDPAEQSDLRFRRGNTLLTLAHDRPELYDAALQDLRAAVELGRASGHALAEINAECVLARAELLTSHPGRALLPEAVSERVVRLVALLPRAEPLGMADRVHDIVSDLEVKRIEQGQPEALSRAIHHGRRAADLAREPWVKAFRLASLAELLFKQGTPEDEAAAAPLAREAVATLPPDAGDLHAVPAHAALGYALLRQGRATEAMEHLQFALGLLARQGPSFNRNLIRLRLAKSLLEQERLDDARHHCELALEDAREIGDQAVQAEATRYLVLLDRQGGQDDRARQRLVEAEAELAGTADQTALTLERLRPRPGEPPSAEFIELIRRYLAGQLATDAESDQVLQALMGHHARHLPQDIRQDLLRQGERFLRDVVVRAHLLAFEKREEEAIDLLRGFLSSAREPDARLNAAVLLLALLPPVERRLELLRWCDEVELLLEGPRDNAYSRSALSDALWRCGRQEPRLLERAWRHAEAGAVTPDIEPDALERNLRIRTRIRLDQVSALALESSPAQQEFATWFTGELLLPANELSGYRCHVVYCLLATGPLTHPGTPALAEQLLALVPPNDRARALSTRLQWIRACLESPRSPPVRPAGMPEEIQGGLDAVPSWVVALAQGELPSPGRVLPSEALGMALAVAEVRPDRSEAVLEWLFSENDDPHLLDRLSDEVAQASGGSGKGLLDRVEKVAASTPSFRLLRLRVTIRRKLAVSGDMASYERAVDALLAFARTPEERVEAKILKGIERMDSDQYAAARQVLGEALEEARRIQWDDGKMFSLLVSAGNAWRKGEAPDIQRALALYAEAEAMGSPIPHESARLWKVMADALLERGGEGDAAAALALLERSLEVRDWGSLRAEALISAARAEHDLPGREAPVRLRRAIDRLEEAARHADGPLLLMAASIQLKLLARLVHLQPGNREFIRRIEELGRRHSELADNARRAIQGKETPVPDDVTSAAMTALDHPAGRAFFKALFCLRGPDLDLAERMARSRGEDPSEARQRLEEAHLREDSSPQGIRALADQLAHEREPQALPGIAVARACLLAHVAEHSLSQREEVEHVAREAEQLVRQMPAGQVRRILLLELSHVWAPGNHYSHPVRDFRRAAELAREVMESSEPGESTARSALQSLARATRYRTDGDIAEHLREADQLYTRCVREYEAAGEGDVAAHLRMNLAELRAERRTGTYLEDLQTGIDAARERLEVIHSPDQQAKARLNLAVPLTMLGSQLPSPRKEELLREAREHFAQIDRTRLSPSDQYSADNYSTICLADLAELMGNHEEAIYLWRQRLESLGRSVPEQVWAYTAHNLADMLLRVRTGSTLAQVLEGLDLSEKILQIRTLERSPAHHWETCENIGRAVAVLLLSRDSGLSLSATYSRTLWEQGRKALRGALAAARRIGSHERLMQSAVALLELARVAPSIATLEAAAGEGWSALDEARPYLLLDERAGALEARLGVAVARVLADRLADDNLVGVADGLGFVLSGERAEFVLRWMVRAVGSAQRRLAGRTARPVGASHHSWVEWLAAIRSGDRRTIERALDVLRREAPAFLRGEPELEGTWSWLRSRPGAAVVAVLGSERDMLAAVLTHDGHKRVLIARLDAGAPPYDEATVARGLTAGGPSEEYHTLLEWARRHIAGPLQGLLSRNPSQLLWVPTGALRVLAPADLWPTVPVTCAVRLDLETRPAPSRPRRTLLAVADPGPGTPRSIPNSIEMGALLARMAQDLGPLRVRMSRGAACGQALGIPCPALVEGPASPDDILREFAEVDVAMLLCHGEVDGPRQARLLLVDGTGALVPLGMERLAEDPRRVAGTTVILLSCQTGRVGDWIHQAAGLAGALLAGGARNVIAPLWPVLLDPALAVGNAVLRTLASGAQLSVELGRLQAPESGPALGRRSKAQREQEQAWSIRAFVHWMG